MEVEAREGYSICIRYADGASGAVDLSDLADRGVFAAWNDLAFFESVDLTDYRAIAWGEDNEIDACADELHMRFTGKTVEEIIQGFRDLAADANHIFGEEA